MPNASAIWLAAKAGAEEANVLWRASNHGLLSADPSTSGFVYLRLTH